MKKKILILVCFSLFTSIFFSGCMTRELLPVEDLEVFQLCEEEIKILKNPSIRANTKAKYEAAKSIIEKADFSFMRQADTVDKIFHHRDAVVDNPNSEVRTFIFNYQYADSYVRFIFNIDKTIVLKAEVIVKD